MSHARFSPSSAHRWINCPGSIAAIEALGDDLGDDSSPASKLGTSAHALLEVCVVLGCRPEVFMGCELEPNHPIVDERMINGVNIALDWIEDYVDQHGAENLIIIPERKVYIGPMIGLTEDECNGTSDLTIIHKDMSCLTTADYKNGVMKVEPEDNPQTMLYTAGDINELDGKKYKRYKNVIIQPNGNQRRPVNEATFTHSKLVKFLSQAENAAAIAKMPDAPRNAGEWCFFCKAKDNCQTRRRKARAAAADEFGEWKDPETIGDDEMEEVLSEADQLLNYVRSVQARALRMAVAGHKFKGYEVGYGKRIRSFESIEEIVSWCKRKKIPEDVYAPREVLSPAKMETMLRATGRIKRAKRGQEKPVSPIEHLIVLSVPKPSLKRKGDNAAEFDDLDGGDE